MNILANFTSTMNKPTAAPVITSMTSPGSSVSLTIPTTNLNKTAFESFANTTTDESYFNTTGESYFNTTPGGSYFNTSGESYFNYTTPLSYFNQPNSTYVPVTVSIPITWVTYILFVVTCCFTALGLLGNSLILISMFKFRRNVNGHSVLVTSLAGCDIFALISWVLTQPCVHDVIGINVPAISNVSCKIAWAILFTTSFSSSAVVVLIGIERFVAVWFPLTTRRIMTPKKTLKIVGSCVTPIVLIYATMPVLYCEIKAGVCHPNFEGSEYSTVLNRMPNTTFYSASIGVMQLLFMLILSVTTPLTVVKLRMQIVLRRRLTREANDTHIATSIKLMAVVIAQMTLNGIPSIMAVSFGLFSIILDKNTISALALSVLLNHSINFLLYNIFDKQFRKNIVALLGFSVRIKKPELQMNNLNVSPVVDIEGE